MKANKCKLKEELKKDVKKLGIKNVKQLTHYFYNNYVSVNDNFNNLKEFEFIKLSDTECLVDDIFNFNKKINILIDRDYHIEYEILSSYDLI